MNLFANEFKPKKIFIVLSIICLFSSCSTQNLLLKSDYNTTVYQDSSLVRKGLFIDNIVDKRYENNKLTKVTNMPDDSRYTTDKFSDYFNPKQIGHATHYILGKNAPLLLDIDLDEFVKNSMNTMLKSELSSKANKIDIVIDSFRVDNKSELWANKAKYISNIKYNFKAADGKMYSFESVYNKVAMQFIDVKNALKGLLYSGLAGTMKDFIAFYDNPDNSLYKRKIVNDTVFVKLQNKEYKDYASSFLLDLCIGDRINSSYSIGYNYNYLPQYSQNSYNAGLKYMYLHLKDENKYKRASFSLLDAGYSIQHFFNEQRNKSFISGGADLFVGKEHLTNDSNEVKKGFIFGPAVNINAGYKLSCFAIQVGVNEMYIFDSDIKNKFWTRVNLGIAIQL